MSCFSNLPFETLQHICSYIKETDFASLVALTLVSKRCHAAAIISLLQTIRIQVYSATQLCLEIEHWHEILRRKACCSQVQCLIVGGQLLDKLDQPEVERTTRSLCTRIKKEYEYELNRNKFVRELPHSTFVADDRSSSFVHDEDKIWAPLAELITHLPALSDFIYACSNQISPCVLQALKQVRPHCRLHMRTFKLRSLNESSTDRHELALATSSSLHNVQLRFDIFDSTGSADHNKLAVMDMVAGLAPRLREVCMVYCPIGNSPALQAALRKPRKSWIGFVSSNKKQRQRSRGSLKRLQLKYFELRSEDIEKWSTITQFSLLEEMSLAGDISTEALQMLGSKSDFPCLTTLSLDFGDANTEYHQIHQAGFAISAEKFFIKLPSLLSLELKGDINSSTLRIILDCHGKTLRRLWLLSRSHHSRAMRTHNEILLIRDSCSLVENLNLMIPRYQSNATEVAIYKTIGSFTKLQTLSLTLATSESKDLPTADADHDEEYKTPFNPRFDSFDHAPYGDPYFGQRPLNGDVRLALINSALDADLAREIYSTIAQSKPRGALPLHNLELHVAGNVAFGLDHSYTSILDVIRHIGRSWSLQRGPRDDRPNEILATEIGREEREEFESWTKMVLDPEVEPVFRRIWPRSSEKGSDWRNDWYSWPLSQE